MISRDDLNPAQPRDVIGSAVFRPRVTSQQVLQGRLTFAIKPITAFLAVGFLLIAIYKSSSGTGASEGLLERMAAGNAIVFLLMRLVIGHFKWPSRNPHAVAFATVALTAGYSMVTILLTGKLWATAYVAITLVFMGFLYASRFWFYFTTVLVCLWWGWWTNPHMQTEDWSPMAGALGVAVISSSCFLELRRRTFGGEREPTTPTLQPAFKIRGDSTTPESTTNRPAAWCPTCKASPDAIIRHDGEMVIDANASATELLGMSVSELAMLPVVGLFPTDKREALQPILRLGNFEGFETFASGFNDECIPIKLLNSGLSKEPSGVRTLIMRDLREVEKLRQGSAAANRRAQQSFCRNRDLAGLARKQLTQDLAQQLKSLVQTVHRWLPCSVGCFVLLWDNAAQQFAITASSAANPLNVDLLTDQSPLLAKLTEGEPVVISKVADDRLKIRHLYTREPVNAYCAFPLMTEHGMMGFFLALDRNNREFAAEELDYLTIVSQFIADACVKGMLEEQLNLTESYEHPTEQ